MRNGNKESCIVLATDSWKMKLFQLYLPIIQYSPIYTGDEYFFLQHKHTTKIVWGCAVKGENLIRVEDGFLRSKGLGVAFNLPLSLIFDDVGLYYDATAPSRLEQILNCSSLTHTQTDAVGELIELIREHNLTKYNFPRKEVTLPKEAAGKQLILVPGQVEGDASITLGSPSVKTNEDLLVRVRAANPQAYILFKPHPDLLARLRKGAPLSNLLRNNCDHIILEGDLISWVKAVDEVHTMTSTVGFEALIHQKRVITYGMPFYAGWGLTTDHQTCLRRTRTLTLDELINGALIEYPTYLNPNTGEHISAITAAKLLADPEFTVPQPNWLWKALLGLKKIQNILPTLRG